MRLLSSSKNKKGIGFVPQAVCVRTCARVAAWSTAALRGSTHPVALFGTCFESPLRPPPPPPPSSAPPFARFKFLDAAAELLPAPSAREPMDDATWSIFAFDCCCASAACRCRYTSPSRHIVCSISARKCCCGPITLYQMNRSMGKFFPKSVSQSVSQSVVYVKKKGGSRRK